MTARQESSSRDQILEAVISELAARGSDLVEIGVICRNLKLSPSLVNHFFGDRSRLLLEAATIGYERYVERQVEAVREAGDNALEQLSAWINAQVQWTIANPGIASMMNFPNLHLPYGEPLGLPLRTRLEESARKNLVVLASILDRIQRDVRGQELLTAQQVASNPGLSAATAYVGWLVYGHSLWRSGQHAPTRDIPEVRVQEEAVFAGIPRIAAQIARALASIG